MKIFRIAALIAVSAGLGVAPAPAGSHGFAPGAQMGAPHMGSGHMGNGRVGANGHFVHPGGFRHHGQFVHGFHGGHLGVFFIAGGFWYPWYAYPYPAYSNASYYCPSAAAYYPAVTYCPEGWVLVEPSAPPL